MKLLLSYKNPGVLENLKVNPSNPEYIRDFSWVFYPLYLPDNSEYYLRF